MLEIIQGKTTVAEAARRFDQPPCGIESWVKQGKAGMENALKARPEDLREQYESQSFLLRSDNGLVSTARAHTRDVRSYGLQQEFITPHCP